MPRQVFMDTSGLVALASKRDSHHLAALELRRTLSAQDALVVTTQWVLAEFLGWMAETPMRVIAGSMTRRLVDSHRVLIIEASGENWTTAFDLYEARRDKGWSLVDCSSIAECQTRGISEIFTTDHHFTQAGLSILLPS